MSQRRRQSGTPQGGQYAPDRKAEGGGTDALAGDPTQKQAAVNAVIADAMDALHKASDVHATGSVNPDGIRQAAATELAARLAPEQAKAANGLRRLYDQLYPVGGHEADQWGSGADWLDALAQTTTRAFGNRPTDSEGFYIDPTEAHDEHTQMAQELGYDSVAEWALDSDFEYTGRDVDPVGDPTGEWLDDNGQPADIHGALEGAYESAQENE